MTEKPATDRDEVVVKLLAKVREEKAAIEKANRPQYVTNCSFSISDQILGNFLCNDSLGPKNSRINLHTVQSVDVLVRMAGFLVVSEDIYQKGYRALGLEDPVPEFIWDGFPSRLWIEDIKMRLGKIQVGSREKKLADLEARLAKLISPEMRTRIELEEIQKELSKT